MAIVKFNKKACTVNPLKMSQPVGGALAFMGIKDAMPLFHGSQGCTSFGLVLFVRHFKEAIPLQTTAMSEVATVLGGYENVEQAIVNISNKQKASLIGICSTGVTETKGDDVDAYIKLVRQQHPELDHVSLVYVSTPDFKDAFQDGWEKTVAKIIETLVKPRPADAPRNSRKIAVLPGSHLTPGDLDELRDIIEAFGFDPLFLPDLAGSLDGHIPEDFTPTTLGGISLDEIADLGDAFYTIAIGSHMRTAAEALKEKAGVPYQLFDRMIGLLPTDDFIAFLTQISGKPVPNKIKRQRGQLVDAMLDGHFHTGGKKIAIGLEPDFLYDLSNFLADMGCQIEVAVTTNQTAILDQVRSEEVLVGDLEDFETLAPGCDLLITHAHGRQASERLHIPLFRMGLPIFDRLGAGHITSVGYRGARDLIFKIANIFIENMHVAKPDTWYPHPGAEEGHASADKLTTH
ncbi:nitrogenase iron-molybdenum cofactor biosynthesis protein NifN [Beijerinckia indica]|uniref:Nitrogenase iron-molybdenum cofactor biosynthesis protein NifN n=1 Tax=Beijerinckia indica subsp. indica (strain ATCC 9039 / DSM 1715 / NCIMB 8712) TaxID=395963 RepID=B2IET6_BEII9|nr:nitrogenase iron-molybdenum cofactor biosynthesis protein NifN [Beijerinckia indica]ACB94130.1 nitrogenase molybdenum-iron cofactor biosynthesis protein NifN [Beijerinckia indica subsp. indica ATCC 9039]